jgi:hypothetical protein
MRASYRVLKLLMRHILAALYISGPVSLQKTSVVSLHAMAQSAQTIWQRTVSHCGQDLIDLLSFGNVIVSYAYFKYRCCGRCELLASLSISRVWGNMLSLIGLLLLRTWAFWQKGRKLLIGLLSYAAVRGEQLQLEEHWPWICNSWQ